MDYIQESFESHVVSSASRYEGIIRIKYWASSRFISPRHDLIQISTKSLQSAVLSSEILISASPGSPSLQTRTDCPAD